MYALLYTEGAIQKTNSHKLHDPFTLKQNYQLSSLRTSYGPCTLASLNTYAGRFASSPIGKTEALSAFSILHHLGF